MIQFSHTAIIILGLVLLGLCCVPLKLHAQTSSNITISSAPISDGWGSWRSLHTKHFSIHFPEDRKKYAIQAAKLFERVHAELAPLYAKPWKPDSKSYKTNVALIFSSDITQGWATTLGINQIVLYLEPPQLGSFSRYEEWLKLLFTHEYTHILSLQIWDPDKTTLFILRILFGVPPNLASPRSFTEGVAVWEESKTGLGRLEDPLTQMTVRTAIWEDAYPSRYELLNFSRHWPGGSIAYLYGGRFMAELERQAGAQAPRQYWALDRLPVSINSRFADLGVQFKQIYAGMRKRDLEYFGKELAQLEIEGLSSYERLSFDGYLKTFLVYDKEKHELIYYARPPNAISGIFRMQLGQKKAQSPAYTQTGL